MDKILDKLGVYDLVGVMFSGLIISIFTKYILTFLDLNFQIEINDTFHLLIISYFIGLIFQEIGSKLNCWKILISTFKPTYDLHISLSQKEVQFLMEEAKNKLGYENVENHLIEIYYYCKLKNNTNVDPEREQSLGGMARSLTMYFLLASSVLMVSFFITLNYMYLPILFFCICFSWLFYNRYKRFMKMKYVDVLRSYYYNCIHD